MFKLFGFLSAFAIMSGIWLGACGALIVVCWVLASMFPAIMGGTFTPDWTLTAGLIIIGIISYGLMKILEKFYPEDRLPDQHRSIWPE